MIRYIRDPARAAMHATHAASSNDIDAWVRRIRLGEDSTLELKRVVVRGRDKVAEPHRHAVADELAAMANAGGGHLVLGVDDRTRETLGIPIEALDAVEHWLGEISQQSIAPPLDIATRHMELPDAAGVLRAVVIISVPRSLWVHRSPGGYLRRVGHARREMSPEFLARLFQQRTQVRMIRFEEQAVPRAQWSDLDPLLVERFVRPGEGEPRTQLQRLRLVIDDEGVLRPTVAGVLNCTRRPTAWLPSACLQAVAYRGRANDPAQQIDAKVFEGPIGHQVWDALDFVARHQLVRAFKALGRTDLPQYSLRAVFEAVVNAVAHRDYSMPSARIRLHLYADRLELNSPGALPNTLTIDAMREVSLPRNEIIASLFSRHFPVDRPGLGREHLMDRRGAGVDIILEESRRLAGRSPVYENLADVELRLTVHAAFASDEQPPD
jgi:predicted HTH transcriptional regulator